MGGGNIRGSVCHCLSVYECVCMIAYVCGCVRVFAWMFECVNECVLVGVGSVNAYVWMFGCARD